MIYTRKCAYSKCGETFQSVAVSAKYCCPSHRTLAWMENQTQSENQIPIEKTKDMDKAEFKKLLIETKEDEKAQEIIKKYPELLAQIERYEKYNSELQEQVVAMKEEKKADCALWKENPDKQAERKLKYYKSLTSKHSPQEIEEPIEIIQHDEYDEYRRQNFMGILLGSLEKRHCEVIQCKRTDEIHKNQLLKDGFILFDERKNERKI